jgi:hypothetical protein
MKLRTIFDHIPKTAGTSVIAAMGRAIGESGTLPEPVYPHHVVLASAGAHRFRAAHMWFHPHEILGADWFYATLLRDPIDRFLSQYYFHRAHRDHVLRGEVTDPVVAGAVHLGLEDYLSSDSADLRRSYTNLQAAHFARRVCDDPESLDNDGLLDAAIASLAEYDLVGVFADPQGFVDVYCDALSVPRQVLPHMNANANRPQADELSDSLLQYLLHCNGADLALYAWACRRFAAYRNKSVHFLSKQLRERKEAESAKAAPSGANFGSREIEIIAAECSCKQGISSPVTAGEQMVVKLHCRASIPEPDLTAGIAVRGSDGSTVFGTNSRLLDIPLAISAPCNFILTMTFAPPAEAGEYYVTLALHKGLTHVDGCYHWIDNAISFSVAGDAANPAVKNEQVMFTLMAA